MLVAVVAVAYLATHVASEWLARRFLVVSGAEYLVLGILLGPQVSGVLGQGALQSFAPVTTLALGWIGATVGIRLFLPDLVRIPGQLYRIAFAETFFTFAAVALLELVAIMLLFDLSLQWAALPALALGALGTTSASHGIDVVAARLGHRTGLLAQLELSVTVNALLAIITLTLLACLYHPPPAGAVRAPTATEWAVISVALGVIGGALFHLFLGRERDIDRLFIALAGAIILVSGAASFLALSPLLPATLVAAILVNTSSAREEIAGALMRADRPFYFVLLIFAGASWQPSSRAWFLPVLLFIAARSMGKLGGARLAARANHALPSLGPHWGRALLGHGGLALALALDYENSHHALLPHLVFTAAIASVLLTDLASARMVSSVVEPIGPPAPAPS